jgi:hypothetical protein
MAEILEHVVAGAEAGRAEVPVMGQRRAPVPISHGMRVDVMAGRSEVSVTVAFRIAKVIDEIHVVI